MKLLACEICEGAKSIVRDWYDSGSEDISEFESALNQCYRQARRDGWEQAKMEASHICRDGIPTSWGFTSSQELSDAINTMEYKEVV